MDVINLDLENLLFDLKLVKNNILLSKEYSKIDEFNKLKKNITIYLFIKKLVIIYFNKSNY